MAVRSTVFNPLFDPTRKRGGRRSPPLLPAAAFTMTQLPNANRVYQRSSQSGGGQGKGQSIIAVPVTVTAAGAIYARVRDVGGSVIQAVTVVASSAAPGTTTSVLVTVDARVGWSYIDLSGDASTWQAGTVQIGVGDITLTAGQSLDSYFMSASDNTLLSSLLAPSPYASVFGSYGSNSYAFPNAAWPSTNSATVAGGTSGLAWEIQSDTGNYRSPAAAKYLSDMVSLTGVNQSLVGNAIGSTAISRYIPTSPGVGPAPYTQLHNMMTAAGGSFARFIWFQGHENTTDAQLPYNTTYYGNLTTMLGDIGPSVIGGASNFFVGGMPNQSTRVAYGPERIFDPIRLAQLNWANDNGATYLDQRGIALFDRTHPNGPGNFTSGAYMANIVAGTGFGPAFAGATVSRSGAVITITPVLPSGSTSLAMVGSSTSNLRRMFRFYQSGTVTNAYPIKTVSVGTTAITVTLTMDPGVGQALDAYYGHAIPINETEIIVDNLGRQLRPNYPSGSGPQAPLVIAAPTPGGATVAPQHFDLDPLTTAKFAGASTGPFASTDCLTNGVVISPYTYFGGPVTIEGRVYFSQLPSLTIVMISHLLNLNISSTGVVQGNFDSVSNTTGSATLAADSTWHHIEISWDLGNTNTFRMFLDGALAFSETQTKPQYAYPGDAPFSLFGAFTGLNTGTRVDGNIRLAEVAIWNSVVHTAAFTPRTTPYVGNEGMANLYHLNANLLDSAVH